MLTTPRLGEIRRLAYALVLLSNVVNASTQCPGVYGSKSPMVDILGWGVVLLGVVVGSVLLAYIAKRSRTFKLGLRLVVMAIGITAMLAAWFGGFIIAFIYFFFQC